MALDVALGTSYDDAQKTRFMNVHYQWGRKDPMLSPAAYNSNNDHAQYGDKQFAVAEGPPRRRNCNQESEQVLLD